MGVAIVDLLAARERQAVQMVDRHFDLDDRGRGRHSDKRCRVVTAAAKIFVDCLTAPEYRTRSTEGSILYPLLAAWSAARGEQTLFEEIAKFSEDTLAHCTFQTWLPAEDSEDCLYLNRDNHNATLAGIPVTGGTSDTLEFIHAEVKSNKHYDQLTAVKLGRWPIVLTACRAHRLPVPPQVWRDLLPHVCRPAGGAVPPSNGGAPETSDDRPEVPR